VKWDSSKFYNQAIALHLTLPHSLPNALYRPAAMPDARHLWTLGLNHQSASLDLRARFAFASDALGSTLAALRSRVGDLPEAALLSTCNRTELYGLGSQASQALALDWLAHIGGVAIDELRPHLYIHTDSQAARHAMRVASGLDSMVLGEPQILGQVKEAVRAANDAGLIGTTLHQLFQRAFSVAKNVRSNTDIGSHSISMAAASTRLAASVFEDWQHTRVLLVGAGEMIELCAAHFAAKNPARMAIANRTATRAVALIETLAARGNTTNIETLSLSELPAHLHEFDVVVSSTASTLPIIGLGAVQHAIKLRKHRPMVMVDLAVPRDIEPEIKALADVYLYTVDDLSNVVQTNLANRSAAVDEAQALVDAGVADFVQWQTTRQTAVPKIQALNEQAAAWQEIEIERVKKQFFKTTDMSQANVDAALQALAKNISNKFLHLAYKAIADSSQGTNE
jgi:glutamyl-tRNA reductase